MNMSKVHVVLMLAGLALGANAQTSTPQAPNSGQNNQGMQPGGQRGQGMSQGGHHHPPKEAIDACQGKASGAACSFVGRHNNNLTGTCFAPPQNNENHPLACRPERPSGQGGQGGSGQGGQGRP
jgi:hypothetical protein